MVIFNISIPDSLVNGTLGTIIDIILDSNGKIEAVIVQFDNPKSGLDQRKDNKEISEKYDEQRGCPIFRATTEYHIGHKRRRNLEHGATNKVTQFPLTLAWASTGHKLQGVTIKKGSNVIAHGNPRMPEGLYYVMLSRAESIENVYLENFLPSKLKPNKEALEEDQRLQERSIVSSFENLEFNFFVVNIRSLSKHLEDLKLRLPTYVPSTL